MKRVGAQLPRDEDGSRVRSVQPPVPNSKSKGRQRPCGLRGKLESQGVEGLGYAGGITPVPRSFKQNPLLPEGFLRWEIRRHSLREKVPPQLFLPISNENPYGMNQGYIISIFGDNITFNFSHATA